MNKMTSELEKLKKEFTFLHEKIGELEWERATMFLGRKAVLQHEIELLEDQINSYTESIVVLLERAREEVRRSNSLLKGNKR